MINELIEKEIEKKVGDWEKKALETFSMFNGTKLCVLCGMKPEGLRMLLTEFGQTIAKGVAMRFKKNKSDGTRQRYFSPIGTWSEGYDNLIESVNNLADQIINEASE